MKSFTTLRGLSRSDLHQLVDEAIAYSRRQRAGEELAGRTVATMFFEPSTRTRLSFELAAHRLGAEVLTLNPATSSTLKGETLRDTALTLRAMGADILVVRHGEEGSADAVHEWTGAPVVNAGDGSNEHPTQTLLDAVTLTRHFGTLDGLRMGIVGDITHSRVAGSHLNAMPTLGVHLTLIGPEALLPEENHDLAVTTNLDDVLPAVDVVYLLRVQRERGAETDDDYVDRFGMTPERAATMKPEAVVMHPGPINRGVEIAGSVADGPRSLILQQVSNGVPTRMAVLAALGEELG